MRPVVPRDPEIASLARRLSAGALDAGISVGAVLVYTGAWFGFVRWRDGHTGLDTLGQVPIPQGRRFSEAMANGQRALEFVSRNRPSPGQRVLGLRRVDARTGSALSARGAIRRTAVEVTHAALLKALWMPRLSRWHEQQSGPWKAEVERIEREHPDDPAARTAAIMALRRRSDIEGPPNCACVFVPILAQAAIASVSALRSPRRQTLLEQLAGTVVISAAR